MFFFVAVHIIPAVMKRVQLNTQILQGSAATDFRWGG